MFNFLVSVYAVTTIVLIYTQCMHCHLTVHTVHQTRLNELDMTRQRYLKKWLGIHTHGRTSLGLFSPYLLGIKPVSQVYLDGHFSAYLNSSLVAGGDTQEAIRCAELRKGVWLRKSSFMTQN